MDLRYAVVDINRIRVLAQELVGLQPDIILTSGGAAIRRGPVDLCRVFLAWELKP